MNAGGMGYLASSIWKTNRSGRAVLLKYFHEYASSFEDTREYTLFVDAIPGEGEIQVMRGGVRIRVGSGWSPDLSQFCHYRNLQLWKQAFEGSTPDK